jgi:aspartyl-tRNA synthetase
VRAPFPRRARPIGRAVSFDKTVGVGESLGTVRAGLHRQRRHAEGPLAKYLPEEAREAIFARAGVAKGDAVFLCRRTGARRSCGRSTALRGHSRPRAGLLLEPDAYRFCWITDFPFFELDDEGKVAFSHNPFSMPQGGLDALNNQDPLTIKAFQYDIVCNGVELSSGAIRNHRPDVMLRAFELAGYGPGRGRAPLWRHVGGIPCAARRRTAVSRPASIASCHAACARAEHPRGHRVPR